jgi:hypothetical protein
MSFMCQAVSFILKSISWRSAALPVMPFTDLMRSLDQIWLQYRGWFCGEWFTKLWWGYCGIEWEFHWILMGFYVIFYGIYGDWWGYSDDIMGVEPVKPASFSQEAKRFTSRPGVLMLCSLNTPSLRICVIVGPETALSDEAGDAHSSGWSDEYS